MLIPLLLLSASLVAQGATPPPASGVSTDALAQAYALFLQARAQEDSGDVPGALATYKKVLDLTPKAAEVHAELAGLYARQGRATQSIDEARAALALNAANTEAHRILGFVQSALAGRAATPAEAQKLKAEAINHFEHALSSGVRDPSAELSLGRLYVDTGSFAKGIIRLQLFLLDRPGYPDALMLLARAFDGTGQTAEAADTLEELVAEQPTEAQPLALLAETYEHLGRWKDAGAAWAELARMNPRSAVYRTRQALAQVNGGDFEGGRQQLAELAKQAPRDVSAWYLLAQIDARGGDPAGAEEAARKITEIDSSDARGAIALAAAKTARGDFRGAVDALDARVKVASDRDVATGLYTRMVSDLAAALDKAGDRPRAIRVLETARQRDLTDLDTAFELASAYERDQRFDDAEKVGREVVAKDPSNAAALNYLGYMLADRGQKLPEAVDLIKRALAIETDNPSFLDSLGWAYFKSAQFEPARDPLEHAAAALPKNSVIQDHLAQLYFQLKRYKDAAAAWDKALAGDHAGIDIADITKKRDNARNLAGR